MASLSKPHQPTPQELLGNFGASATGRFQYAWKLFKTNDDDAVSEAYNICTQLLVHAELGDVPRAGCHLILAHSNLDFVYHARTARDLYENLYTVRPGSSYDGSFTPSIAGRAKQRKLLDQAKTLVALAERDEKAIQKDYDKQVTKFRDYYKRDPTAAELIEFDVESQRDGINEYFEEIDEVMFAIQAEIDRLDAEDLADAASDADTGDGGGAGTSGPSRPKGKGIAASDSDDGIDDAPMTIYKPVT